MDIITDFIRSVLADPDRRELLLELLAQEGFPKGGQVEERKN
jgi:hypothetical protein